MYIYLFIYSSSVLRRAAAQTGSFKSDRLLYSVYARRVYVCVFVCVCLCERAYIYTHTHTHEDRSEK